MRYVLLLGTVLFAGMAHASSIVQLTTSTHERTTSVVALPCIKCPAPADKEEESAYRIPMLKGDVQSVHILNIGGEKKIVRTEAWMGGSPVVYINKLPDWMTSDQMHAQIEIGKHDSVEAQVQKAIAQAAPVDFSTQTGALEATPKAAPELGEVPLRLE